MKLSYLKYLNPKKSGVFAAGVLFGTAGIKVLASKDAKKVYSSCVAAALRAKDCVVKTATVVQENAGDILAEAKEINEQRAREEAQAEEFVFEEESVRTQEEAPEETEE